jgi:hypothetical protein
MEGAVKRIQRAWRSRTAARLAVLQPCRSGSVAGSTRSSLGPARSGSCPGILPSPSVAAVPGGLIDVSVFGSAAAAAGEDGLIVRPYSCKVPSSPSQIISPSGLTGSSYTGETSYSSYTLYSDEPSGFTGCMLSGASGLTGASVSLQPSQASALGLVGAYSSELSGKSAGAERSAGIWHEYAAGGAGGGRWGGGQGRETYARGGGSFGVTIGSSIGARSGQQQAGLSPTGTAGSANHFPGAFAAGSSSMGGDAAGHGPVQRGQGVDLAAGLASFKAAGLVPTSLDSTPRLVRK